MSALRVLHVDSGREWRGGQNQARLLCRELARAGGVPQVLVTKRGSELARRATADGVAVAGVAWTLGPDPVAWWGLVVRALAFRPTLVHAHDSHALRVALWARAFLDRYAREPVPRVVATRRVDFHVRRRRGPARWLLGDSPWARADRIMAISRAVKAVLVSDGIAAADIAIVPSGIDPEEVRRAAATPLRIRRQLGLPEDARLAVSVGALVGHKDQQTLIRAAHGARALRPDLQWAIAGAGQLRGALEAEIARLGLRDRVHLLGYVEQADALIREADVFVLSSKEEGLGSVILHALALEKPVVATAAGGIPEILPPEALVPVGDHEALARKVVATLTHPTPHCPLPEKFTARAMAEGVMAVYRSLL